QQGPRRGRDIETTVSLSFEEAVVGVEKDLKLSFDDECKHCKGETVEPGYSLKTCDTCRGAGPRVRVVNTMLCAIHQAATCQTCRGKGKVPEKPCTVCKGTGVTKQEQTITVKIPAGIDDGATLRLRERGEAVGGGSRGDLYVHVRVKAHKKFTREGDLILSEEHVSMIDAALGTEIEVETVDGRVR